jgi:hypothetical protein
MEKYRELVVLSVLVFIMLSILTISLISALSAWLIGEYLYVFECPNDEIHTHNECPTEKNKGFYFWHHIKVSETEEKKEELEITGPILRIAKGGLCKSSAVLWPKNFTGNCFWTIKRCGNQAVELCNHLFECAIKPVSFSNALFFLSNNSMRQDTLWGVLMGYQHRCAEVKSLTSKVVQLTCLGIDVCRLILDLKGSKDKMRSPVGQKAREALEAGLAKLPPEEVENWMAVARQEKAAQEKTAAAAPTAAAA